MILFKLLQHGEHSDDFSRENNTNRSCKSRVVSQTEHAHCIIYQPLFPNELLNRIVSMFTGN